MRGRKPVPTALKILRGNPGKRAINREEPAPGSLPSEPPEELLDDVCRGEWARVIAPAIARGGSALSSFRNLNRNERVSTEDRSVLVTVDEWLSAEIDPDRLPRAKDYPLRPDGFDRWGPGRRRNIQFPPKPLRVPRQIPLQGFPARVLLRQRDVAP